MGSFFASGLSLWTILVRLKLLLVKTFHLIHHLEMTILINSNQLEALMQCQTLEVPHLQLMTFQISIQDQPHLQLTVLEAVVILLVGLNQHLHQTVLVDHLKPQPKHQHNNQMISVDLLNNKIHHKVRLQVYQKILDLLNNNQQLFESAKRDLAKFYDERKQKTEAAREQHRASKSTVGFVPSSDVESWTNISELIDWDESNKDMESDISRMRAVMLDLKR